LVCCPPDGFYRKIPQAPGEGAQKNSRIKAYSADSAYCAALNYTEKMAVFYFYGIDPDLHLYRSVQFFDPVYPGQKILVFGVLIAEAYLLCG
jgi:hypothetical protein